MGGFHSFEGARERGLITVTESRYEYSSHVVIQCIIYSVTHSTLNPM